MANEVTITASLTASKGGASIASGSLSKTLDMTGADVQAQTQLIGHAADEAVDISADIGTEGYVLIKNLDASNYVTLSYDTGGSFAGYTFAVIPAGGLMLFKPSYPTGKTVIYAQANTADVNVQYWIHEA